MGLITVDKFKCQRDGFCVRECPAAIIELPPDAPPRILPGAEDGCMDCGHCLAVCPFDALRHERIPVSGSPVIREDLRIRADAAAQFLRARRSIRHFLERPVDRETLRTLIETARYAPTGGNRQEVEWLVIDEQPRLRKIGALTVEWLREIIRNPQTAAAAPYLIPTIDAWDAGTDSILRGAPCLVVAIAPGDVMTGAVDTVIAQSYLDLQASAMGLGTCWAGLLEGALVHLPAAREAVEIPENYPHHYPMMVGHPAVRFYRMPERKPPKITFCGSSAPSGPSEA